MSEENTKLEIENIAPTLHPSKSFIQKLYESATKSPMGAVSSIAALFMVAIMAVAISSFFYSCPSS